MQSKAHWEHVYQSKQVDQVSWFQEHAIQSLAMLHESGVGTRGAILDVGGGASTFVDDLLADGYRNVTVVDIAEAALSATRRRLGADAAHVQWVVGDVTQLSLAANAFDFWHDRAVFHFLTEEVERQAYVRAVLRSLKPGGYLMVATFAEDGPERCSGLPAMRYPPSALQGAFGEAFSLARHAREEHRTPFGTTQAFTYCLFRRSSTELDG